MPAEKPHSSFIRHVFAACLVFCPIAAGAAELCQGFGPQAPRDIQWTEGTNPVVFAEAPSIAHLNLCNMHFHKHAEHRGPGFDVDAGEGTYGGFACGGPGVERASEGEVVCENVAVGDTIEVHWVYTSCNVEPGPKLDSCSSKACANPQLRVEAQVFRVVSGDDGSGATDAGLTMRPTTGTGDPVVYAGSTTGPDFTASECSNLQVTWGVRPLCADLHASSLAAWCADNPFDERRAHGVRPLVVAPELLSRIR